MNNVLNLASLGNVNIATQLDSGYRRSVTLHNQKVTDNRYILNIIINCIRFCGALELALRGHDETESSSNPGVFRALINFSGGLDSVLKSHLEKATVFKGTSKTIQNELLQCMLQVCQEEIRKEIKDAEFLAVIADETSDVACVFQMVIVYRYIINGRPVERFWDFIAPEKHDAQSLATYIIQQINLHLENSPHKLIAQTYDGAAVMSGSSSGVQALVKEKFSNASYIHCYAHQLNLIMLKAASTNKNVRIFFTKLQGLCSFFSVSPQRTAILDETVRKRLPRSVPTRWNFQSRSVNTVFEYREDIIKCLNNMTDGEKLCNENTMIQACSLVTILKDERFIFWLSFFHKIMINVDVLYNQLQKRDIDPTYAQNQLTAFEREITNIREGLNEDSVDLHEYQKRGRNENGGVMCNLLREAKEVCDVVSYNAKERFKFTGHLVAASLFLPEKFITYSSSFPETSFRVATDCYSFLEAKKLRTELSVIYGREEFKSMCGGLSLLHYITDNNLCGTLSESVKLLKAIITIPMTTSEAERCFSSLKRIKTFLRNTMAQERLSALAMLSVERDFVLGIPDFNERVIVKFANMKERRMDFLYK